MAIGSLENTTIASRYKSLLKLTGTGNDVLAADAAAKVVEDGDGNDSALALSTNRVGIGTSTPKCLTQISGSAASITLANHRLQVGDVGTDEHYHTIGFGYVAGDGTHTPGYIGFQTKSATGYTNGDLIFGTRSGTTNAAPDERMRIKSDGNVGIGTSDPHENLDIYNDNATNANCTLRIINEYNGADSEIKLQAKTDAGGAHYAVLKLDGTSEDFVIDMEDTSGAFTILQNGNVGIGTAFPGQSLAVKKDQNAATAISVTNENTGSSADSRISWYSSDQNFNAIFYGSGHSGGADKFVFTDSATSDVCFDISGKVGIGTTTPSDVLTVHGNFKINTTNTDGNESRFKITPGGPSDDCIVSIYDDNQTETIRLDASGKVGIGTESPVQELEVVGDIAVLRTDVSATRYVGITQSNGDMATSTASIGFISDGTDQKISFSTHNSGSTSGVRMLIDEDGNVGIGDTDPANRLTLKESTNNQDVIIKFSGLNTNGNGRSGFIGYCPDAVDSNDNYVWIGGQTTTPTLAVTYEERVGIGTTTPSYKLHTESSGTAMFAKTTGTNYVARFQNTNGDDSSDGILILVGSDAPDTGGYWIACQDNANSSAETEWGVRGDGTDAGATIYDRSDRRSKENIVDIPDALSIVSNLKPRNFTWKAKNGNAPSGKLQ